MNWIIKAFEEIGNKIGGRSYPGLTEMRDINT